MEGAAMRPVSPDIGFPEVALARDQPEYFELTAAVIPYDDGRVGIVTRWRLTDEFLLSCIPGMP